MSDPAWSLVPLDDVADVRVSNVDKKSVAGETPVRLCNYMDVYSTPYLVGLENYMRATATTSELARFGLQSGDVLITKDSETPDDIAIPAIVDRTEPDVVCGYHLAIIRPGPKLDPTWLGKQFSSDAARRYFGARATGSTRYGLSNGAIGSFAFPVPPLPHQKAAAKVLRTLDEAIQKTEQVIAKLKQMKQGLLHDLLTRGVDENGGLRDPRRHPDQFEESPIGLMPIAWSVANLRGCLDGSAQNGIYKPPSDIGSGTLLLGQTAITETRSIDPKAARRARVNRNEVRRFGLLAGDILVSRVFATLAGVGQPALVPHLGEEAVYESNMMRLRVDPAKVQAQLLVELLRISGVRRQVASVANLSNQASINQTGLHGLLFALPQLSEQRRMLAILDSATGREEVEARQSKKLRQLRQALTEDLLTGRVRVTKLLKGEAA